MKPRFLVLGLVFWLVSGAAARADSVILVHGYLGSAGSWRGTGIAAVLDRRGWRDAGHLRISPRGVVAFGNGTGSATRFYTIDLPSEAPVALQANILLRYMTFVAARHGKEPIILAAHSAGGIVARFAMVTSRGANASALITIASPHMGARLAELGSMVAESPLSWFAPFVGGNTVNRSRILYRDLSPERPGNLLGWLNRQPHPPAKYISVIRVNSKAAPLEGDGMVVAWSQDMNSVPALRGKSQRIMSPGNHDLRPADGYLLADILNRLRG